MGIDLPFALVHAGEHVRYIRAPLSPLVLFLIEGIRVRVYADAFELAQNDAGDELLQLGVLVDQAQIGPHLGAGIPQPHGMDVTRIYKGVVVTHRMDRGVKRVGKTIGKHPGQPVVFKELGHFLDFRFNGGGDEKSLTGRRALGLILLGLADSSGGKQENQGEINRFFHFSA